MSRVIQIINKKVAKEIYDCINPEIVILDKESYSELVSYYKTLTPSYEFNNINDVLKINVHGLLLEVFLSNKTNEVIEVYGKKYKM